MEFKFRAGEDRPSSYLAPSPTDAYFTTQALRAGYLGANLQRPDPLQNPMMILSREAVLRELEKERIREEIIAAEILRKRELEEEVRREVAYEREVVLRRQAERFSLLGRKHNKANEEELLIASRNGGGNNIEAKEFVIPKKVKRQWYCDLCHVSATSGHDLNEHLHGKKHKVEEKELLIASKFASSSANLKKAYNSYKHGKHGVTSNGQYKKLRQHVPNKTVGNTESIFESHLNGKKHFVCMQNPKAPVIKGKGKSRAHWVAKTREENNKSGGNKNNNAPTLKIADKSNNRMKNVMTTSTSKWQQMPQIGSPEKQRQVPKTHSESGKKNPIRSEHCNVECDSELILESHLRGEKHLARMQEVETLKEVSVNHIGSVECGKVDVDKAVEIVEVKQSIENHQDERVVESETTSIGNYQYEQVVALASEKTDGVPIPSKEEMFDRTEDRARKIFSLGNLIQAIVRFCFILSIAGN
ncbi:hypothetical protein AAC387_Pa04g0948 [Persea americana]